MFHKCIQEHGSGMRKDDLPIHYLREKFLNGYTPEPNTGCWLWDLAYSDKGYALMQVGKKRRKIYGHRFSYEFFNGKIKDLHVLHRCDTPACVNPDHLFLGTQADNNRDMFSKGRAKPGRHAYRDMNFCIRGHEYTSKNTSLRTYPDGSYKGRECLTCKKLNRKDR